MLNENTVVLDRYRIEALAGKGGMGRVYRARDLTDGSLWAIKEDLEGDPDDLLREEAELLSSLNHPALPACRGMHTWRGNKLMIMEFVEGVTLSEKLKTQSKFPEPVVEQWFREICDILCYLHSRSHPVVYRDLKPSNIMVDAGNRIRIIDFGIAEEYSGDQRMEKGGLTGGMLPRSSTTAGSGQMSARIFMLWASPCTICSQEKIQPDHLMNSCRCGSFLRK